MQPRRKQYLAKIADKAAKPSATTPQIREIVAHIVRQFGGAEKIAILYKEVYDKAETPATKGRLLEAFLRMLQISTAGDGGSMDDITTEDIQREVQAQMVRLAEGGDDAEEDGEHVCPPTDAGGAVPAEDAGPPEPAGSPGADGPDEAPPRTAGGTGEAESGGPAPL